MALLHESDRCLELYFVGYPYLPRYSVSDLLLERPFHLLEQATTFSIQKALIAITEFWVSLKSLLPMAFVEPSVRDVLQGAPPYLRVKTFCSILH